MPGSPLQRLRDRVRVAWLTLRGGQQRAAQRLHASAGQTDRRRATAVRDYLLLTPMDHAVLEACALGPAHDDVLVHALQRDPLRALSCTLGSDVRLEPPHEDRVVALLHRLVPPGTPEAARLLRAWLHPPNGERPGAMQAIERTLAPWFRPILLQPADRDDSTFDLHTLDLLLENATLTAEDLAQIYAHATQRSRRVPTHFLFRLTHHPAHPPTLPPGAADLVRDDLQRGENLIPALDIVTAHPSIIEGLQLPADRVAAVFERNEPMGLRLWGFMPPAEGAALWRQVFHETPEHALGLLASLSPQMLTALGFHRDDVKRLLRHPDKQIRTGALALVGVLPSTTPASSPQVAPPLWPGEPEPVDAACHDPQLAAWCRGQDPAVAAYRTVAEQQEATARMQRQQEESLRRQRWMRRNAGI